MKRASLLLLLAVFALGCGRKVVVHPDKLATKGDAAWRITAEPGAPPLSATAPFPPTSPQGTPNAPPPGVGTPSAPPPSPSAPLPPSTPPRR